MFQDYKDLLSAFHAHGVRYLIVGGYAVIFHAQPRFTRDIDLFIKADSANAHATYAALAEFGAPLQGVRPEDFADRGTFFRFERDPRGFDILPDIPGVDFDAVWERRVEGVIDGKSGLKAHFISAEDLITAKLAAGRPQDLADVDAIRKAAESQGPQRA
jgi:predicted nucleotidyltransferase